MIEEFIGRCKAGDWSRALVVSSKPVDTTFMDQLGRLPRIKLTSVAIKKFASCFYYFRIPSHSLNVSVRATPQDWHFEIKKNRSAKIKVIRRFVHFWTGNW